MIGIVVGLAEEAKLARRLGGSVCVGNGTAAGAQRAVDELVRRGATALLSFGVAGGLAPGLVAGTILIPDSVLTVAGDIPCDGRLVRQLGGPTQGAMLGYGDVVATVADKARLHAQTGAVAIDLESGVVAMTAQAEGLPFAVVRAICDAASCSLPHAALVALDEDGRLKPLAVLAALARRPEEIISVARLTSSAWSARRSLRRFVDRGRQLLEPWQGTSPSHN